MNQLVRGIAALAAAAALLVWAPGSGSCSGSESESGGTVTAGGWCLDVQPTADGPCPTSPKPPTPR